MNVGEKVMVEAVIDTKVTNTLKTYYYCHIDQYDTLGDGNFVSSVSFILDEKYNKYYTKEK